MAFEHKPGTFSLFKNDKKESDKHPDYKGYGKDIEGADIDVAAWIKEGKNGKFMSCKFSAKMERQPQREPQKSRGGPVDDMDEDLPF